MRRPDQTIPAGARQEILAEFMDAMNRALDLVADPEPSKPVDFDLVPE